jgi:beta-lactamase class A
MKLIAAAAVMEAIDHKQTRLSDVVVVRPEDASPGPQEFADLVRSKGALSTTV